ncbi:hypothetical protein CDL12_15838 [Handroanthus impetiginosus]|uniref:Cyclin-dependent kinase inhibitor n=1 Tax=Handroanthus impetiginosus TaxID=429701 RepID=A0A2G9H224_9LAMI|nr:hypothetical protein CDL12_15838 [Handroanthus impetiginosus]
MKKAKSCTLHHAEASLGVQTRAITKKSSTPSDLRTIGDNLTVEKGGDGCYLQLRSRRLERRAAPLPKKPKKLRNISAKENDEKEKEEGSFGESEVGFVKKGRESTPNRLIVGSDIIRTPMSNNKATSTNANAMKKMQIVIPRVPNAQEVEEFLAKAEKKQIERFIEEYNFDPVNEKPLKGRYKWEEFKP